MKEKLRTDNIERGILKELTSIPGIGKNLAADLYDLNIKKVSDLKKRNPDKMYKDLCIIRSQDIDRCVLYVFRCAVYFATHQEYNPELLKWWNWKDRTL